MPQLNGEKEREVEEKNLPLSLVVGVAYIECTTPHPLSYKVEHECHNVNLLLV